MLREREIGASMIGRPWSDTLRSRASAPGLPRRDGRRDASAGPHPTSEQTDDLHEAHVIAHLERRDNRDDGAERRHENCRHIAHRVRWGWMVPDAQVEQRTSI